MEICSKKAYKLDGEIKYGENGYVEFHPGNMNLLISVPHDGSMLPDSIPSRTKDEKNNNLKRDMNTKKIAFEIRDHLKVLFKDEAKIPFIVVNNLHRMKMDPNREPNHCCDNNSVAASKAYNEYHDYISINFKENFIKSNNFPTGLIIDLHGQKHPENMIELGYLLSSNHLNNDLHLKNSKISSIYKLASTSKYTFEDLIRGSVSLGGILETNLQGVVNIVPSVTHRSPGSANYYSGGYIIEKHGSKYTNGHIRSNINAIQIELPAFMRTDADYSKYTPNLAFSIYEFYTMHNF